METEGVTAGLRNALLLTMARARIKLSHLIPADHKGPNGLTLADAEAILARQ